jgi:hypothetical protein
VWAFPGFCKDLSGIRLRVDGTLFMEFNIPRMGKRIDAVVVAGAMT